MNRLIVAMPALLLAVLLVAVPMPADAFTFGVEYAHEFHNGWVARRRIPSEFGTSAATRFDARMHRLTLVDTTGNLLAGLAGGAAHYNAKRKAIRKWAREGGHDDTIEYDYTMPSVVPGPRTRLSFAWGAGLGDVYNRHKAIERKVPEATEDLWSLEILVDFRTWTLLPGDRLFMTFSSHIWWKTITVRPVGEKEAMPKEKWQGVGDAFIGFVCNLEVGSMILPSLRVIAYAGWDPLTGAFALLQGPESAPEHNWQYGAKADFTIGDYFMLHADYSFFSGGLGMGESARKYIANMVQLRAGVYF